MTSSWFFLSTLNYDARSTTHHILKFCHKQKVTFLVTVVNSRVVFSELGGWGLGIASQQSRDHYGDDYYNYSEINWTELFTKCIILCRFYIIVKTLRYTSFGDALLLSRVLQLCRVDTVYWGYISNNLAYFYNSIWLIYWCLLSRSSLTALILPKNVFSTEIFVCIYLLLYSKRMLS